MLKSIGVVLGCYVLSVILVMATDPLLSRIFPGDFVKGRIPSNAALFESTALFIVISILCAWLCAHYAQPPRTPCALVHDPRRGDGYRLDDSPLEQRLAALVLAVLAPHLAGKLLGGTSVRPPQGAIDLFLETRIAGIRTARPEPLS